jgi:methanogenic corrinoid protein MtbC1
MGPQSDGGSRRRAPWADRLEARLLAGDSRGAWGVVEAALAAGAELDEVYLEVVSPAMAAIGERWEQGQLDIFVEHRATGIVMRLIGRLGPRFVRRGRTRGAVIIGAPSGESHALPVAIVSDLLRQHGWEVSDLGPDVPAESFVRAMQITPDVVAVGVSVTNSDHLEAARESLEALRRADPGVLLVVGGRAVRDDDHARELGADAAVQGARSLTDLLESIRSADGRPTQAAGN